MQLDFIGIIESGYWSDTPNTAEVKSALDAGQGEKIDVNIASEGGDVFEAFKIAALLDSYNGKTSATGFGLVASAATIIMSSCDEKKMTKGSFYMIHNSWTLGMGDKEEMQKQADLMGKIDDMMAEIYTNCIENSGKLIDGDKAKTKKKVLKMMQDETWLTAEEAKALGLIDEVVTQEKEIPMQAAVMGRIRAQASNFKHIPQEILNDNNMQNDKKGLFAKFLQLFGYSTSEAKAELEAIEAPESVGNATETEDTKAEAVTDNQETETTETVDAEGLNEQIEALKAELATLQAQNEALNAKVTELEVKAKTKLPVRNEPKVEETGKKEIITASMKSDMDNYLKSKGLIK